MKKLLYSLTLIILISSCRSIDKMVEKGDYDSAIIYAAKKLAGKKKKKTKHVKGLEEAFAKITARDLAQITFLDGDQNPANWERIEIIADNMARRQKHIQPLIPLVSKDGYEAYFEFVDTYTIKTMAINGAAAFHYMNGTNLLAQSEKTANKRLARQAHHNFEKVSQRIYNYKNIHDLLSLAKEAGTEHIKIEVVNNSYAYLPAEVNNYLASIDVSPYHTNWRRYHLDNKANIDFDKLARLELTEISLSPEREQVSYHTDEKRIKDGYRYLKDKKGKIKKDSTGKKIKIKKFKTVSAEVTEVYREKTAYVRGYLKIIDSSSYSQDSSRPLSVEAIFSDYASSYIGDRRAVCDKDHSRLKSHPNPFPHDIDIITDATNKLKDSFMTALANTTING